MPHARNAWSAQAAVDDAVRKILLKVHPDHNFGTPEATERTRLVLEARGLIKSAVRDAPTTA